MGSYELFNFRDLIVGKRSGLNVVCSGDDTVILLKPAVADGGFAVNFSFTSDSADNINVFISIKHIPEEERQKKRVLYHIENFLERGVGYGKIGHRDERRLPFCRRKGCLNNLINRK